MKHSIEWIKRWVWIVTVMFAAGGCRERPSDRLEKDSLNVSYARYFRVEQCDGYKIAEVYSPWDSTKVRHRYILVDRDRPLPDHLPSGTVLRTPLRRVAVLASVHCGMLQELRTEDCIRGVCEPDYIELESIRKGIASGTIVDLGEASAPDIEQLITLSPEAVIVSPFKNVGYGRMEKTGIPILECVDYLETTPLGRAEWMRFLGLFFDREQRADSLFQSTRAAYDTLRSLADGQTYRPTVLSEKRYAGVWYVPGGESYMAHLFRDAGADYLWRETADNGSLSLSFEQVFERGAQADYWLIKYNAVTELSYAGLQKEYELYRHFEAFEHRRIYVCHTGEVPYYEELPMHPDRVLKDLIRMFHPSLLPDHTLRYFTPMKE